MLRTALGLNLSSAKISFFYQICFVFISLRRGTRSTFGSLVPVGNPGQERNMSVITVTLLVELSNKMIFVADSGQCLGCAVMMMMLIEQYFTNSP